jgi:type II secretory pathway component PulF
MKYDELAFFNQQLAVMLREGIPLEGALRQLSGGMRDPALRQEVGQLEADLARGIPLREALQKRALPEFYSRMLVLGASGNDLPGVLQLLADYYHRVNLTWTRLKGLMVYPLIVLVAASGFTIFLAFLAERLMSQMQALLWYQGPWAVSSPFFWALPSVLVLAATVWAVGLTQRRFRNFLRWTVPALRDASLAQLAAALALMLKGGTPLAEALAFAEKLEDGTPAGEALARWREQVARGEGRPAQWESLRPFPPMFLWLLRQSGESPGLGFANAAALYNARAQYRTELLLYGFLPVSVLLLGSIVMVQALPVFQGLARFMNMLGDVSGL